MLSLKNIFKLTFPFTKSLHFFTHCISSFVLQITLIIYNNYNFGKRKSQAFWNEYTELIERGFRNNKNKRAHNGNKKVYIAVYTLYRCITAEKGRVETSIVLNENTNSTSFRSKVHAC